MLIDNTYHVSYCTNIHPGENWKQTLESLKQYIPSIKQSVSDKQDFGIGLRLSNIASEELGVGTTLNEFKNWLDKNGLYVFTMNGFPYGNFHKERVKDKVHTPDWTTQDRVTYTKRLFDQLAVLVPVGISGGISTSPISYKHWFSSKKELDTACKTGATNMIAIVLHLIRIEKTTGKQLHLDIEPEPDGILENSDEVVHFFNNYLHPIAQKVIGDTLGISPIEVGKMVHKYINVCYDVCHFSLAYEEPENTLGKFAKAGIKVGKIQVSAALKMKFTKENREQIWDSLSLFNEPTYLHQVTEMKGDLVKTYNDLPAILENKEDVSELRAHFHVPIFIEQFNELYSTQDQILKVIDYLKRHHFSNQLEIETYTWDVLPEELKIDVSQSIIRELNWLIEKL